MAPIENRSCFVVSVQHRDDLTETFAHSREGELKAPPLRLKNFGLTETCRLICKSGRQFLIYRNLVEEQG
jgi:hypothetical protein